MIARLFKYIKGLILRNSNLDDDDEYTYEITIHKEYRKWKKKI